MITLRKALAIFVIVFVVSVGSVREGWGQSQTLTAFYTAPVASMSPMWIAKEAGFFKKQGLDVKLVYIGQSIPALKTGSIDALVAGAPHDLFALRLGFKVILDITALKIPFAVTVLASARNTVERKQQELTKFMRAYAEAMHYFLTNPEGTAQVVSKYTKVEDRELVNYAIQSEAKAMDRTLQVELKGIELILGLIGKTVPQAASAKAEDFYDTRFTADLKDSGFLKRLWGEK